MNPFQYIIVVGSFLVVYILGLITIYETRAIRDELAKIKKFQQNTVAPMHQHILDKLTKLAPDEK
jgi:hypothetical protein